MFQLSTDGILRYAEHHLCCALLTVPANQQYDRYNADQDAQCCEEYRCRTLLLSPVERLSQFAAAQPSAALRAMEGILRTLRYTPLIFALQKKSTYGIPDGLPSVASAKDGGR